MNNKTKSDPQVFNCKTEKCTGKVSFIDKVIPALTAGSGQNKKKIVDVDLTCDNLIGGPHINSYQVVIYR
jgi:hypothetical protein